MEITAIFLGIQLLKIKWQVIFYSKQEKERKRERKREKSEEGGEMYT